jgi:hypothetical protein
MNLLMRYTKFMLPVLFFSATLAAQEAEDRLDMEGTAIIGNKELPLMLYIVPWKPAQRIDIPTPPIVSILDRPLQKIERNEFRRQVKFHQAVFPTTVNNQ